MDQPAGSFVGKIVLVAAACAALAAVPFVLSRFSTPIIQHPGFGSRVRVEEVCGGKLWKNPGLTPSLATGVGEG